jgi:hypothetical protein
MEYQLESVEDRIARKVTKMPTGCHVWTGKRLPAGYGNIKYKGRIQYVHRVAWELENGEIPEGLVIDHLCKNPSCVRVSHLEVVTQRENALRGDGPTARNAHKTECKRGHPFDEENTLIVKTKYGTGRQCRICTAMRSKRKYETARNARMEGVLDD